MQSSRRARPYAFNWVSGVESSTIGVDPFVEAGTHSQFGMVGGNLSFVGTSSGSGVLLPGDYVLAGYALARVVSIDTRAWATARYHFDLNLTPAPAPIPEPGTVAPCHGLARARAHWGAAATHVMRRAD